MIDYKRVKQIFFYTHPLDMRRGMSSIQVLLGYNFSPIEMMYTLFVFCSKNRKTIKIYFEDEYGCWLLINKLNYTDFKWPKKISNNSYDKSELDLLLKGLKIMDERVKEITY